MSLKEPHGVLEIPFDGGLVEYGVLSGRQAERRCRGRSSRSKKKQEQRKATAHHRGQIMFANVGIA
jgi:hypothetical protein